MCVDACNVDWLLKGEVQKLVVIVTGVETQEVLERWAFEVHADQKTDAP
jgi:mitotic spindle assembly checkpoint protein MAD2